MTHPYRYEAELRDTAPFDAWHSQHVAADAAAHAAAVQQRRDEMAAAQEAGVQARQQLVRENLEAGRKLKVGQQPVQIILHLPSGGVANRPDVCRGQQKGGLEALACSFVRWHC